MKKIFLFFAITIVIILGCEKDKPSCWSCTQINTYAMPGFLPDTTISVTVRCNLTEKQIYYFEHENTYKGQESYNGYVIKTTNSCKCTKTNKDEIKR
jgi:hypothetical protein